MVLLKALIADKLPADKQSAIYGKLGAFAALGFILAPIISGIVLETKGGFYNLSLLLMTLSATSLGKRLLLFSLKLNTGLLRLNVGQIR